MGSFPVPRGPATNDVARLSRTVGTRQHRLGGHVLAWPMALSVGAKLPTVPPSLAADVCLLLELEASYRDACRRRVEEAR